MKWNMERQHGDSVPQMSEVDVGGGITNHICGVLPLGDKNGVMNGNRLTVSNA